MAKRTATPARRRYFIRLFAFMALYMAFLIPVVWSHSRGYWPEGPLQYVLALAPALPVFGVIWAILAYVVEEEDEYFRHLHIRATLAATGITLGVCTAWGFLSNFSDFPSANLMYVFVIFCAALFVGMGLTSWRAR